MFNTKTPLRGLLECNQSDQGRHIDAAAEHVKSLN